MKRDNWFRRTTWTTSDQEQFYARLNRSRAANRAQYLRIQAGHLGAAGAPECFWAALGLLDKVLVEHPDDIELAQVYLQQADCWLGLGNVENAVGCYRKALQRERRFPKLKTDAFLGFGWMVVEGELTDLYEEAAAVLKEFRRPDDLLFPIDKYRFNAILALIDEDRGDYESAKNHAEVALEAAKQRVSGFRYHPKLGLVSGTPTKIQLRLERLART